jgi:hypothetical protein
MDDFQILNEFKIERKKKTEMKKNITRPAHRLGRMCGGCTAPTSRCISPPIGSAANSLCCVQDTYPGPDKANSSHAN